MIVVKNDILPPGRFVAMTLWPFIFVNRQISETTINHEEIHGRQQVEMTIAGCMLSIVTYFIFGIWSLCFIPLFYIWYGIEWLVKLFFCKNVYKSISFEREAYQNERNMDYLSDRNIFCFIKYL